MIQSRELYRRLLDAIMDIPAVDIHTSISHTAPYAGELWELLGDHYLAEQAVSVGLDKASVSEDGSEDEMVDRLVSAMNSFDNTVQHQWIMDIAQDLFGFQHPKLNRQNWHELAEAVRQQTSRNVNERSNAILGKANIEKVFTPVDFNMDLPQKNVNDAFVPVLNAKELIFGLHKPEIRKRLKKHTKIAVSDSTSARDAFDEVLKGLIKFGGRGVCIELPAHFQVFPVVERDIDAAIEKCEAKKPLSADETAHLQCGVLFSLAELCNAYGLPVMLKSGKAAGAYKHGVPLGKDLPVAGATLRSLLPLFNSFPKLNWCVSILSGSQAQELITYGWIIQNVIVTGHWRYHSIPEYIERDLAARIQSVPKTKIIGYYSDMSKLEFGYAKYLMYRRILAKVLTVDLVMAGRGTEDDALNIARYLLRDNAYRIFRLDDNSGGPSA